MLRVLRKGCHLVSPWANGRGETLEVLRLERDGALLWRLSVATVVEDGPFSLLPDLERCLTVISGEGFELELDLERDPARAQGATEEAQGELEGWPRPCRPLTPVYFSGALPVRAARTGGRPSEDLNVMTRRGLPRPEVSPLAPLRAPLTLAPREGELLCALALGPLSLGAPGGARALSRLDVVVCDEPITLLPAREGVRAGVVLIRAVVAGI